MDRSKFDVFRDHILKCIFDYDRRIFSSNAAKADNAEIEFFLMARHIQSTTIFQ